jgi:hypothetical protein
MRSRGRALYRANGFPTVTKPRRQASEQRSPDAAYGFGPSTSRKGEQSPGGATGPRHGQDRYTLEPVADTVPLTEAEASGKASYVCGSRDRRP